MFVPVSNPKGAISCENFLHPYKKLNQILTRDKALELLAHTNFQRNIFDLLSLIDKQNLGAELKDVVLACCDRRNPTERNLNLARSIAEKYHYQDELAQILEHNNDDDFALAYLSNSEASVVLPYDEAGRYHACDWHQIFNARQVILDGKSTLEMAQPKPNALCDYRAIDVFRNFYRLSFNDANMRFAEKVAFEHINKMWLGNYTKQGWKKVAFHHVEHLVCDKYAKLPEVFDVSGCSMLELDCADCTELKTLKLDDNIERIVLSHIPAEGFFQKPDFQNCRCVELKYMEASILDKAQIIDGAELKLFECSHLPEVLDLTRFGKVKINSCADFNDVKEIRFRDGAEVYFSQQMFSNLQNIQTIKADFSKLSKIDFGNLFALVPPERLFQKVEFADGAEVAMVGAQLLGNTMDFSRCAKVTFNQCNLDGVPSQYLQFAKGAIANFFNVRNIPFGTDISQCAEVDLSGEYTDLTAFKSLKFAQNSKLNLEELTAVPSELDVAECASLSLIHIKTPLPRLDCRNVREFCAVDVNFNKHPLRFAPDAIVELRNCSNLGADTDFSNCARLQCFKTDVSALNVLKIQDGGDLMLHSHQDKPIVVDVAHLAKVDLFRVNIGKAQKWKFADGAEIAFEFVDNLNGEFCANHCAKLMIEDCDVDKLTFQLDEPRELHLKYVKNLQNEIPNIPFHQADTVFIKDCDLLCTWDMHFKQGSQVSLEFLNGTIPPTLDVSECAEVGLYNLHRHSQPLKFAPHSKVAFYRSTLPKQVDVSQCAQVSFYMVDAAQTENLTFADNSKVEVDDMNAWPKLFDASHVRHLQYKNCSFDGVRGVLIGDNLQALQLDNVSDFPTLLDFKQTPLVLWRNLWDNDVHKIQVNQDYQRDMLVALNPEVKFKDKIQVRFPKQFATQMPPLKLNRSNKASLKFAQTVRANPKRGR